VRAKKHVLVAGASGLVGCAAMKHFAKAGDCEVTAVSRRKPAETFGANFIAADLTDTKRCSEIFGALSGVTHLVYAALYEKPGLMQGWVEDDQIAINDLMLRNLFEPLEKSNPDLHHVSLLQGTKAYGAHVRALSVPAREDRDELRTQKNFYWQQESYIKEKSADRSWSWTIFRPQIIFGMSLGSAMNLIPAIGVYGALLKEQGKPLSFPGGTGAVLEAVDSDLLARAIGWAGEADAARNQAFNVTNGDIFVWQNVWPAIADALGMEAGPALPQSLGVAMPARAADWDRLRAKHNLVSPGLDAFIGESFHYADFCMAYGVERSVPPAIVSTVKIRRSGFHDVIDTEDMFRKSFREFQDARLLPPRGRS
jgi:nucleoside-diphosphate-sugar epimerase